MCDNIRWWIIPTKWIAWIASGAKKEYIQDILVYTGYTFEELKKNFMSNDALKYIDVLLKGEYIDSLNEEGNLRGSSNQKYIFLIII